MGDLVTCCDVWWTDGRRGRGGGGGGGGGGGYLTNNLEALSCKVGPRAGGQSIHKSASMQLVAHDAMDGHHETEIFWPGTSPCVSITCGT